MTNRSNPELYAGTAPIGLLKGFSPLPHQLELDVVVPHREAGLPGFGEFLLIELDTAEALVGRVSRYHAAGQLVTERGDAYLADLAKERDAVPAPIMRQMLRYNLKIQLLGHLRAKEGQFIFSVGQRSFATLGSNVRLPSDTALAFLCNVGLEDDPTASLLGHLAYGQRVLENVPVRFSVSRLKGRRSFVFARAGYGKSNLIKYLVSQLYSSPPDVGLLIFDPEGEYALPDAHGRPGLINVPTLCERLSLYTNRHVSQDFARFVRGEVFLDFADFPPQDIVAAFVPPEKQELVFANLLRSLKLDVWKKLVGLLAEQDYEARESEIAKAIRYRPRRADEGDVIIGAIKNNLLPSIRRLHKSGATIGKNLREELRLNRVIVVDISMLGSDEARGISGLLLRHVFQYNLKHFTDAGQTSLRCLAVIEEAQTVLGDRWMDDRNIFVRWVKEGRKYGLGVVLVTQQPGAISDQIISQGDNFFALHLLNETDLQTLRRHNAYYSDEILSYLRAEPIIGNCYFWSAPNQPFVLPVRVCNFETQSAKLAPAAVTKPESKSTSRQLNEQVVQAVRDALMTDLQVWLYPVATFAGKAESDWVAFSADYLQRAVAQRLNANPDWLQNTLPREIETVLKHNKARSGYAVLAGAARRVWVIPQADLKLAKGKKIRDEVVEITNEI